MHAWTHSITNFCLTSVLLVVLCGCGLGGGGGDPEGDGDAPGSPDTPGVSTESSTPEGAGTESTGPAESVGETTEKVGEEDPPIGPEGEGKTEPASEAQGEKSEEDAAPKFAEYPTEELTPQCQELLDQIVDLDKSIPTHFMELGRPADEIDKDMLREIQLCRAFLIGCESPLSAARVKSILSRVLLARQLRYRRALQSQKLPEAEYRVKSRAYLGEIVALAEGAIADCPENTLSRLLALRSLMDAYLNLGFYDDSHYEKSREIAARLMKEYPIYPWRTDVIASVSQSYLRQAKYEDAVKYLYDVIDKYSDDPDYAIYNIRLFDSLTGAGDLEGMEELMQLVRAEYPVRIEKETSAALRNQYEQWYNCQSLFWLGFIRMAYGDMEGAEKIFTQHVAEVDSLEAKRAADNVPLDNVCKIIRDFRSQHLIQFIRTIYGKKPEVDLDDVIWITDQKLTLKESLGKVVVLVFRRPGDNRAATFLQGMDRLVKARGDEGLVGVTMGYFSGRPNPEADAAKMEAWGEDLEKLGVTLPAGFDPDRRSQKTMRSLYATVGTASCTVINRKGEVAWWLADCRDVDRKIALRVIERLLAEE